MASRRAKKSRAKKQLEKSVKEANRRLQSMQSQGLGKISTVKKGLREYAKITGAYKPTFEIPKKLKGADVELLQKNINKFLKSNWTTKKGRTAIYEKTKQTFMSGNVGILAGQKLSEEKALRIMDSFGSTEVQRAIEKGLLSSDQIIQIVRDTEYTARQISEKISKAIKENVDSDMAIDYIKYD